MFPQPEKTTFTPLRLDIGPVYSEVIGCPSGHAHSLMRRLQAIGFGCEPHTQGDFIGCFMLESEPRPHPCPVPVPINIGARAVLTVLLVPDPDVTEYAQLLADRNTRRGGSRHNKHPPQNNEEEGNHSCHCYAA